MAQQPGEQADVDAVVVAHGIGQPFVVQADAQRPGQLPELREQVLPFADPQVVDELVAAEPAELGGGELLLLLLDVVPQVQETGEVRVLVAETGMLLRGELLLVRRDARAGPGWSAPRPGSSLRGHSRACRPPQSSGPAGDPTGSWASCCPTAVSPPLLASPGLTALKAPSSRRSVTPSLIARESGGSTNGKFSTSLGPRATPMAVICRMTAARLVRRISGSVNSGRDSKSSSEYSRMAMPSDTRPHRPERWLAEAWDTRSMGSRWTLVRCE